MTRRVSIGALVWAIVLTFMAALPVEDARAHGRSVSYSNFAIDDAGAEITLRIALLELSRLGPQAVSSELAFEGEASAEAFARSLALVADGARCAHAGPVSRTADGAGFVRFRWRVDCPTTTGALAIESRILLDVAPSHLHFARVRFAVDPNAIHERVLTEAAPRFALRSAAADPGRGPRPDGSETPEASRFADYVRLGVVHILSGWDHLAFLLGLVLLAERFGAIARLVTGFTLAHSLTLALAVFDLVHPRAEAVEAVIAYSVALVAAEKGWILSGRSRAIPLGLLALLAVLAVPSLAALTKNPSLASAPTAPALSAQTILGLALFTTCYFALGERTERIALRLALTFAFGLVHGFGFAGILVELDLPSDRLVPALAGFNLGVELGQLACVLVAWPLVAGATRALPASLRQGARDLALAGLAGVGTYWLFVRSFPF